MQRVAVLAAALLILSSLGYANLFTNGDFETVDGRLNIVYPGPGPFSGPPQPRPLNQLPSLGFAGIYSSLPAWQVVAGAGVEVQVQQVLGVTPHSGLYYIELDSHPHPTLGSSVSAIQQTVPLRGLPHTFTVAAEGPHAGAGYGGLIDDISLIQTGAYTYRLSLFYMPRTTLWGQNRVVVYGSGPALVSDFAAPSTFGHQLLECDGVNTSTLTTPDDRRPDNVGWTECAVEFTATPEPATSALVGAGLVAVFFLRRRRRQ